MTKKSKNVAAKNVVILLDNSGSMQSCASKVPSVLRDAIANLGAKDRVTLRRFGYDVRDPDFVNLTKSKIGVIDYQPNEGATGIYRAIAKVGPINGLVLLITDGLDNVDSTYWLSQAKKVINEGYLNDNYTIGVMCPKYMVGAMKLTLGIDNVTGWDNVEEMREGTQSATRIYASSSGQTIRSGLFDANVKVEKVEKLAPISMPQTHQVTKEQDIRGFAETWLGSYSKGTLYYQLSKRELVQEYKQIIFQNRKTGEWFKDTIAKCRSALGLPRGKRIELVPGNLGDFNVYIQSTSVNRKLVRGTRVVYYPN